MSGDLVSKTKAPIENSSLLILIAVVVSVISLALWPPLASRCLTLVGATLEAALCLASAFGWGSLWFRRRADNAADANQNTCPWTWKILLGIGMMSSIVFISASVGAYRPLLSLSIIAIGSFISLRDIRRMHRRDIKFPIAIPWEVAPVILALALTLGAPVIFWDCCAYHLAIPEYLNVHGALLDRTNYIFGFYPQAAESLYATVLWMPFGETAAQLLNLALMMLAVSVAVSSLPESERRLGWMLAASTPGLVMLAYLPKNSGLLAFAGIVAFEAALSETRSNQSDVPSVVSPKNAASIAGAALGIGLATHYGAIWSVFLILPLLVKRGLRITARSVAAVAVFCAPVFIRNFAVTGNPWFPFLSFLVSKDAPSAFSMGVDTLSFPTFAERFYLPWTSMEPLGVGSTLGLAIPLGILTAWLVRRERPLLNALARFAVGAGILLAGTAIHSRPRYGIAGLFILLPLAAHGLVAYRRKINPLIFLQCVIGFLLLVGGPLAPLLPLSSMTDDAYRMRTDAAYPLAVFAANNLPAGSRIATVGILRPYHWKGLLEEVDEIGRPDMAAILEHSKNGIQAVDALKQKGYGFFAVDPAEWARLQKGYGQLVLDREQSRVFSELEALSEKIATSGGATLYRLPTSSTRASGEQTAASATTNPS